MKIVFAAVASIILTSSLPALAEDVAGYLSVCDEAIAARQPNPLLYHRTSQSISISVLSREAFEGALKGAKQEFHDRQIGKFDRKEIVPRDVTIIIDYEATSAASEVVRKRSSCEFRLNAPSGTIPVDFVEVDGVMHSLWKLQNR